MTQETFADLGISFPLFEAPIEATPDYVGVAKCDICRKSEQHCFRIGIGGYVKIECRRCSYQQFSQGCDAFSDKCDHCTTQLLDETGLDDYPLACYSCLRSGGASITKDTEFGMITYQEAQRGVTHGIPGLTTTMFETLPPNDEGWVSVKIPNKHLKELISTPGYSSWQGDIWLFCCEKPMTFIGEWKQADFQKHVFDNDAVLKLAKSMVSFDVHRYWDGGFPNQLCFYVFHCKVCDNRRAHTDMD